MIILFGDHDDLKKVYVEPLKPVRKDWPVVEIKDANHITCIEAAIQGRNPEMAGETRRHAIPVAS